MTAFRRRMLPPIGALQSFVVAARHESISAAAEEIGLTQSAVSRQIAHLESWLNTPLFVRIGRRVVLTDSGRAYAESIAPALDSIRRATGHALSPRTGAEFTIATLPSFGMRWLAPRLPQLTAAQPELVVNFIARTLPFALSEEGFDAAIHYGGEDWPDVAHDFLFHEESVLVCSPAFLSRHPINTPDDLLNAPLLAQTVRVDAWRTWFRLAGKTPEHIPISARFEHFLMLTQAAVAGGGVALAPRFLIEPELQSGALVSPLDISLRSEEAYYFVYPHDRLASAAFRRLRDWILNEAAGGA